MIFLIKEDIGDYSFPGERTVAIFDIGNGSPGQILDEWRTYVNNIVEKEYSRRSKDYRVRKQLVDQTYKIWPLVKFLTEIIQLKELIFEEYFI